MAHVTAVSNGKGGVGKTNTSWNLGSGLALAGKKVLMIENDPQGNLVHAAFGKDRVPLDILDGKRPGVSNTFHLYGDIDEGTAEPYQLKDNLYIIGASTKLSEINNKPPEVMFNFAEHVSMLKEKHQPDVILIDCLPSMGVLQSSAYAASDSVLIPTLLKDFSVEGLKQQLKAIQQIKKHYRPQLTICGVLANQVSAQKVLIEEMCRKELIELCGAAMFKVEINHTTLFDQALALQMSMLEYQPKSKYSDQYRQLVDEFLTRIEGAAQ